MRKVSNWTQSSDEEEAEKETPAASILKAQLRQINPPYRLYLSNIPSTIPEDLLSILGVQEDEKYLAALHFVGDGKEAIVRASDLNIACRIASRHQRVFENSALHVSLRLHQRRRTENLGNNNNSSEKSSNLLTADGKLRIPKKGHAENRTNNNSLFGDPKPADSFSKDNEFDRRLKEGLENLNLYLQQQPIANQPKIKIPPRVNR